MQTYKAPVSARTFGLTSTILGVFGAAFCWWTPLGMVISLAGLIAGIIGWTVAGRGTTAIRLVAVGMLFSAAALTLDCVIAGMGLELVKFQALR